MRSKFPARVARLLCLALALSWAVPAEATKQVVLAGLSASPGTGLVNNFAGLMGPAEVGWVLVSVEASVAGIVSTAGTISNLRIKLTTAPNNGIGVQDYIFTVRLNLADTVLACTVSETATTCSDTSHSVSVAAGDRVTLQCDPNGGPAATMVRWSVVFDSTTPAHTMLLGTSGGDNGSSTATRYACLHGTVSTQSVESSVRTLVPTAGTVKNLYIRLSAAPGAGTGRTLTVLKNGSATGLTCTISGVDAVTCNDTSNTVTVSAGDSLSLQNTPNTSPALATIQCGVTFVPNTEGEFLIAQSVVDTTDLTATEYAHVSGGNTTLTGTEVNKRNLVQNPSPGLVLKKLYVEVTTAPGTGKSLGFTARQNAVDTSLTCTVAGTATTCNATADVTVADDDLLGHKIVPTSSPSATTFRATLLGFLRPRRVLRIDE